MKLKLQTMTLILLAFSVHASQLTPKGMSSIDGIVLDAVTGKPLSEVRVMGAPVHEMVLTNKDGAFSIPAVEPGRAVLTFSKSGYIDQALNYLFIAGQHVQDPNVRLATAGVVAGRLSNLRGELAPNVAVILLRYRATEGGRLMTRYAFGQTDDRGEYRIFDVPPGRYLVAFGWHRPDDEPQNPKTEFPTLYPGVSRISDAETIEVTAGGETYLKNVTQSSQQGVLRIHFINSGPGELPKDITYELGYETPRRNGYEQEFYPKIKFHINVGEEIVRTIWPAQFGIHSITTSWTSANGTPEFIVTPIEFDGESSDTTIILSKPKGSLNIRGTKQQLDGSIVPLTSAQIGICLSMTGACSSSRFWVSNINTVHPESRSPFILGKEGLRNLSGIATGTYELYSVLPNTVRPNGFYLASARQGNRNVLTDGIMISEKSSPLEIQFRPNAGVVEGKVTDSEGHAIHNALVALLPEPPLDASKLRALRRSIRTDQLGSFELQDMIPGNYRAYAWSEVQDDEYLNETFVAPYKDRGLPIQVGTKKTINLKLLNE